jgi:hypothetical protein
MAFYESSRTDARVFLRLSSTLWGLEEKVWRHLRSRASLRSERVVIAESILSISPNSKNMGFEVNYKRCFN